MHRLRRWTLGGGLASGKSMVRELLTQEGLYTVDADSIGHDVLGPDGPAFDDVAARWPGVVDAGEINRGLLADIVFSRPKELETLESITHPHIFGRIRELVDDADGLVIVEVPVMRHDLGGSWGSIVVDSRDQTRLTRAVERGMSLADAVARIKNQPSRSEWLAAGDLVVPNHGTEQELASTVSELIVVLHRNE